MYDIKKNITHLGVHTSHSHRFLRNVIYSGVFFFPFNTIFKLLYHQSTIYIHKITYSITTPTHIHNKNIQPFLTQILQIIMYLMTQWRNETGIWQQYASATFFVHLSLKMKSLLVYKTSHYERCSRTYVRHFHTFSR